MQPDSRYLLLIVGFIFRQQRFELLNGLHSLCIPLLGLKLSGISFQLGVDRPADTFVPLKIEGLLVKTDSLAYVFFQNCVTLVNRQQSQAMVALRLLKQA
jgi:hypothetical protein